MVVSDVCGRGDADAVIGLRMRLYKSSVCSIMVYGSEAWTLSETVCKRLNGANARMVCIISGKSPKQEATGAECTFNLVRWIRARRLQWAGHILRMGSQRMIKQALYEMFNAPHQVTC